MSVPALLTSTPGVTRKRMVLRSFFSGMMPRSRRELYGQQGCRDRQRLRPRSEILMGPLLVSVSGVRWMRAAGSARVWRR